MASPARDLDANARNGPAVEAAFHAAPDDVIAEIIDGELFLQPRPAKRHTLAATNAGTLLNMRFGFGEGGPGGWVILFEPEIHLGPKPDKIAPDLAGWRRERMPDPTGPDESPCYYDVAPDWICEILSSATASRDRVKKMRIYRREGVGHVWLADPIAQTLEVFRLESGRYLLLDTYEGDEVIKAEPFDAVEISLGLLWGQQTSNPERA